MQFDYNGFTIFHGEDDEADARVMEIVLDKLEYNGAYRREKLGHKMLDSVTGCTSVEKKLVLIDIGLPGISGKEILESIRGDNRTRGMPVIMMTGSSSIKDYHDCISLGVNGYIKKSADHRHLMNVCRRIFEGWWLQSQQNFY
jgi:DNA-binding response OmpR family regulator